MESVPCTTTMPASRTLPASAVRMLRWACAINSSISSSRMAEESRVITSWQVTSTLPGSSTWACAKISAMLKVGRRDPSAVVVQEIVPPVPRMTILEACSAGAAGDALVSMWPRLVISGLVVTPDTCVTLLARTSPVADRGGENAGSHAEKRYTLTQHHKEYSFSWLRLH